MVGPQMKRERTSLANPPGEIMTIIGVAEFLRCHPTTIYQLVHGHQIPAFRLGGDWRFRRDDIEKWVTQEETRALADEGQVMTRRRKGRPKH
jgi:excisionase family DNA binding protein